jgi:hypothetical protein
MTNPFTGIITQDLKDTFKNAIDSLLEQTALTLPCRLIYSGTKFIKCSNCQFNSVTGKSNNIYMPGGPISFSHGVCPYCNGNGKIPDEDTEVIYLMVIWDYRKFIPIGSVIANPQGSIQTVCSVNHITKLKKAKEIIVDTNIERFVRHKFMRDSEPNPAGFGSDDYIVTLWKRV